MKQNWKLVFIGVTVMFLMQSCVTMRSPHHHHRHRYCLVVAQPIIVTTLFNLSSVECVAVSEPTVYGNKG